MPKKLPFTQDDLDDMLDKILVPPAKTEVETGNPYIDRLRMAAQKRKIKTPKLPRIL